MYSPRDILNYVYENDLDMDFLSAIANQVQNFSIGEIADKKFTYINNVCRFKSEGYHLDLEIKDDEIITAVINKLYVSAFISRKENTYNVHFLVHQYPVSMKSQFEEQIADEVFRYMIMNTIVALRLDTPQKVEEYVR